MNLTASVLSMASVVRTCHGRVGVISSEQYGLGGAHLPWESGGDKQRTVWPRWCAPAMGKKSGRHGLS